MRMPAVLRCPLFGGLEIACARAWYLFLASEAEWHDDDDRAERYRERAQTLSHRVNGSVIDHTLEKAITDLHRRFRDV